MTRTRKSNPEGRLFAIGDIHGCPDELSAILKSIAPVAGDTVVFVGDYVDRGPSSREVIELALELERGDAECVFLKGNHEDMMLSFLGMPGNYGESFLFNGGIATLDSYGVHEEDLEDAHARLPGAHLDFMNRLATSYLRPPYLFVHAGIMPTRQLEEQQAEDMLWIRQEFIYNPHKIDATVVFGHTPMKGGDDRPAVQTRDRHRAGVRRQADLRRVLRGRALPGPARKPGGQEPQHRAGLNGVGAVFRGLRTHARFDDSRWRRSSVG